MSSDESDNPKKRINIAKMIDQVSSNINTHIPWYSKKGPHSVSRENTFRTNAYKEINNMDESSDDKIDENQELEYEERNAKERSKVKRKYTNQALNDSKAFFFVHKKPNNKTSNMSIVTNIKKAGFVRQMTQTKTSL